MPITVKKIALWRKDVEDKPGALAGILKTLAAAGADLQVLMGYRYPGDPGKAAIELHPVVGKKSLAAARSAGLHASSIPTLLIEGDNKPGLGAVVTRAIADAGVNVAFFVAQVISRKYSAIIGFETEEDARRAASLIRTITTGKKK
ncbi:MAG: hypothetical protein NTW28_08615 [Candidatus Solibacter sp.]|nr:hypothetical protein [Candidatus Solibacter sp.]